ncbi:MAG: cobalt-zinc-cadmium efflux system membrane fusion protein, partial [Planctomycetaceae bacterium]
TLGGIVTVPDGASVFVTAPVAGTLQQAGATKPIAGQKVTAGQTVLQLLPLLSPEREVPTASERVAMANAKASLISSQITADGDVKQAEAQVEAAQIALVRAKRLLADKAGSGRDVDDAQARLDIAIQGRNAASARKQQLDKLTLEAAAGTITNIPVHAPHAGILRTVSSSVGQTVSLAAPLFEVVTLDTLWVRVPVYPGQRGEIAQQRDALVRNLGDDTEGVLVKPVDAPPSADPVAATVDLFYELPNTDNRFRQGERVEVILPLEGQAESLVIPRAAVLRDIHGVAWVYVNSAEHTFERHRVEVHFTTKDTAVLSRGPTVGTKIVVDGAAELFGTEFGAGK